jgi:DNA gyrase subunit B
MEQLCRTLVTLEDNLIALERRGISLREHAQRRDAQSGRLPIYHVTIGRTQHWFTARRELDDFLARQEQSAGASAAAEDQPPESAEDEHNGQQATDVHFVELHEVRSINTQLAELRGMGFELDSLLPQERTGVEEPRYKLRRGENVTGLDDLRGLLAAVRSAGEKGMQITRFKGLGEMNAEELRDTTLHPSNRTLLQVRMEDASAADDMFRILMGDKVEPRREFIEKHALEVRNLDV